MCVCVFMYVHMCASTVTTCRFQASSDAEKMEWVEKLSNAILVGLNMAPEEKPGKGVKAEVRLKHEIKQKHVVSTGNVELIN